MELADLVELLRYANWQLPQKIAQNEPQHELEAVSRLPVESLLIDYCRQVAAAVAILVHVVKRAYRFSAMSILLY